MQITKLIICGVDICYVAHPHLINITNREILYRIWILKIDVIRVGRMVRLAFVLVISLLRFAKQSAECRHRFGRVLHGQAFYCLPDTPCEQALWGPRNTIFF